MKLLAAILLACVCVCAQAQTRDDPLSSGEVDQLRDAAQQPQQRTDLFVSFAKARMLAVERLRSSTGLTAPDKASDLLAELAAVVDEMDDNLDMYNEHSEDLRLALRHVLDAEQDLLKRLQAFDDSATPVQRRHFAAALQDASDSVKTSSQSAQAMLTDQIAKKGELKEKEEKTHFWERKKKPETQESNAENE